MPSRRRTGRRLLQALSWSLAVWFAVTALLVLALRWLPPPTSAFMLQKAWAGGDGYRLRQQWVDWERISPQLKLAALAAEDQRFPDHHGMDITSLRNALADYRDGGRLRGASTISQQVAKNLFLWPGRSLARKGLEVYFTGLIEMLWPKRRILEVYLNLAEFGHGIFGAEAAAGVYFGKPAGRLTRQEAALLAAVLPNPLRLQAHRPSPYVRARQAWILNQMSGLGGTQYLRRLEP